MGITGAALGNKAQNFGLIQLQGFRGRQIVRCQNNRHIRVDAAVHNSQQIVQNTLGYVFDVCSTSLHISIVHCCKHGSKLDACLLDGILCIAELFFNESGHAFHKVIVLHEHCVGFE